jgi:putative transposase
MPRRARIVAVGLPHHITQRGNFSQAVFENDKDRERYLSWIQEYSAKYKLSNLAYCLMPNHIHFISIPRQEESLARTFNTAHMRYSQYANRKNQRSGHLWQGRFFSCVLDGQHLVAAARYIERNPVRAKLVDKPWQWKWSSAAFHAQRGKSSITLEDIFKFIEIRPLEWEKLMIATEDKDTVESIKRHTLVGRPLGNSHFLETMEKRFQIKLPVLRRGRPASRK